MYNLRSQFSRRPAGRTIREDGTRRSSPGNTHLVIIIFSGITATEGTAQVGIWAYILNAHGNMDG